MQLMLTPLLFLFAFVREVHDLWKDQRYRSLLTWVGLILLGGTLFYHNEEGWTLIDSLYFCVVSLGTIGYGDFVPTSNLSKIFTIVYSMIGLSIIATFLNMIAKDRTLIRQKRMEKIDTDRDALDHS